MVIISGVAYALQGVLNPSDSLLSSGIQVVDSQRPRHSLRIVPFVMMQVASAGDVNHTRAG